jgi:hypothetical protein
LKSFSTNILKTSFLFFNSGETHLNVHDELYNVGRKKLERERVDLVLKIMTYLYPPPLPPPHPSPPCQPVSFDMTAMQRQAELGEGWSSGVWPVVKKGAIWLRGVKSDKEIGIYSSSGV